MATSTVKQHTRKHTHTSIERVKTCRQGGALYTCFRSSRIKGSCLCAALAVLVFLNALPNEYTFDDHWIIEGNESIHGLSGIVSGFFESYWTTDRENGLYRPVTLASYQLDREFWGTLPFGTHLGNLLLHAVVTILVFLISNRLLGGVVGLVAGVVFAVHPIHCEAVSSAVGRAELLAALGTLGAVHVVLSGRGGREGRESIARILAAAGLFFFAFCAKESAVVYPLLLVVLVWFQKGWCSLGQVLRRTAEHLWAAIVVGTGVFILRLAVLGGAALPGGTRIHPIDNPLVDVGFIEAGLTALKVLFLYLWILVCPVHLSADYSFPQIRPLEALQLQSFGVIGLAACGMAVLIWLFRLRSIWVLGPAIFILTILPTSNLVFRVGTLMGERLLYLPSFGFAIVTGMVIAKLPRSLWRVACLCCLTLLLGGRAMDRNQDWSCDLTLFSSAVTVCPDSSRAHLNLGLARWQAGRRDLAEQEMRTALDLIPTYARARTKLAALLRENGRLEEANREIQRVLLEAPDLPDALLTAGNIATDCADLKSAERHFRRLNAVQPGSSNGAFNLANTLRAQGRIEEAIATYRNLVTRSPCHAGAWTNLVDVCIGINDVKRARNVVEEGELCFQRLVADSGEHVRLDPAWGSFCTVAGYTYLVAGEAQKSRQILHRAIQLQPDLVKAHLFLAMASTEQNPERALQAYQDVLRLDPDNLQARVGRAWLRVVDVGQSGHSPEKALDEITEVLKKFPDLQQGLLIRALARVELLRSTETRMDLCSLLDSRTLPESLRGIGWYCYGLVEFHYGRAEEAAHALERGQQLAGGHPLGRKLAGILMKDSN